MQHCKILIVEDELLVAADLENSLVEAGHQVVGTADSYPQALLLTEQRRPDVVLMDIGLRGERNGVSAARAIREQWETPVIFLTANADPQTIAAARTAGPYGFLTKPFRNEEVTEAVRIAVEQHHRSQQLFASHHWLTTVLDSMTDAVIATDAKGNVRYLNPAAEMLTGWTPVDAAGLPIEDVYPLAELDGTPVRHCLLRRALETGQFLSRRRFCLRTRSGRIVPIEDSAAPIQEEDRVTGAVTIFLDVSERLASERRHELERDRLEEQANTAAEALGQTRDELRALAGRLITSQEQERQRIARELHDDLGQQTAVLGMLIDRISRQERDLESRLVTELRNQVQQLSEGLREVSHRLHPSIIADLGLSASLQQLVEQEHNLGRDVSFLERNAPSAIPVATATTLYRIAQEALRNAAKHAPGASVWITVFSEGGDLQMRIQDNGPGFSPIETRGRGGLGFVSMQERARLIGGDLSLTTIAGEGTTILLRVSLDT